MPYVALALASLSVAAATVFPMEFGAEIGPQSHGSRIELAGGLAVEPDGEVANGIARITGVARNGHRWNFHQPVNQKKPGWTSLWTADFDADGQRDLLIASTKPEGGVCPQMVTITIVLFDGAGRPVPHVLETLLPGAMAFPLAQFWLPSLPGPKGPPYWPIHITDANGDGRAEFAPITCEPSLQAAEDPIAIRRIYEAGPGARLRQVVAPDLDAYQKLKKLYP
jgi:hypothetical protein